MHYALVGPGALGCLLASAAIQGLLEDEKFTILDHNPRRAKKLATDGIVYDLQGDTTTYAVDAAADPEQLGHVDVLIVCVKSYDVPDCLQFCKPAISHTTLILLMQNGIGHLRFASEGCGVTAFGTTTEGATGLGPGQVRHAGRGLTQLGFPGTADEKFQQKLKSTRDLFTRGGMEVQITGDILSKLWAKLFVNVGINALTAILDCKNGELLTLPGASERMERAIHEAVEVARKISIKIESNPTQLTRLVCEKTATNISSMLQDVRNRKRTEIGAINGAVVDLANELGIAAPENELLVEQVKEIERSYE